MAFELERSYANRFLSERNRDLMVWGEWYKILLYIGETVEVHTCKYKLDNQYGSLQSEMTTEVYYTLYCEKWEKSI